MKRLTVFDGEFWLHKDFPPVREDTVDEFVDCVKDMASRLASIENILGDDYDLDCLKELVEADRDGRCVVLSNGSYTDKDGEKALKKAMFILSLTNNGINRYITDAIAEKLVREQAEAALERMEEGEK